MMHPVTPSEVGKNPEKIICDYFDKLFSCFNPGDFNEWEKPMIHPCKKRYDFHCVKSVRIRSYSGPYFPEF